jgi:hypothetical protein
MEWTGMAEDMLQLAICCEEDKESASSKKIWGTFFSVAEITVCLTCPTSVATNL